MRLDRKSYRRIVGALSACVVVLGAGALIGGGDAQAADGDFVRLGFGNSATSGTSINTSSSVGLLVATMDTSSTSAGLLGEGPIGVEGSGSGYGVWGTTSDNTRAGVYGVNTATSNSGGAGVVGIAQHNTGVQAISSGGTALEVQGVASFSRSGKATVPIGSAKVTVTNVELTHSSLVLATVQQTGRPAVRAAVPNVANHRFTIYLDKPTAKKTLVAWFVLG